MKVERSSLDQVKARFAQNKRKMEEKQKNYDLEERVAEVKEEASNSDQIFVKSRVKWSLWQLSNRKTSALSFRRVILLHFFPNDPYNS